MSAIITAVNSSVISRLTLTCKLVYKDVRSKLKEMSKFLESEDNFSAYQKTLEEGACEHRVPIFGAIRIQYYPLAINPLYSRAYS